MLFTKNEAFPQWLREFSIHNLKLAYIRKENFLLPNVMYWREKTMLSHRSTWCLIKWNWHQCKLMENILAQRWEQYWCSVWSSIIAVLRAALAQCWGYFFPSVCGPGSFPDSASYDRICWLSTLLIIIVINIIIKKTYSSLFRTIYCL